MTDHMVMAESAAARRARPVVRKIALSDVRDALIQGFDDFKAIPTQLVFLCVIYPVMGAVLARAAAGYALLPLIYPLITGFALVSPFAALGLYEISRRRDRGLPASWINVFDVLKSPSRVAIGSLGLVLMAIFVAWLDSAQAIYDMIFGRPAPISISAFAHLVVSTESGWALFILGNIVGFFFALLVLVLTVVSFPLLLDRNVGVVVAVETSIRAVVANPMPMAAWGVIVAGSLLLGSLPFFVGLAVVLPVLGHATWHLYRKVVVSQ